MIKSKQIKRKGNSKLEPTIVLEESLFHKEEFLDSKSDGEKAIIAMVADIAYNLSLAKDHLMDDNFLNSPGVVLIDELETHLHPNWQRRIVPLLTETFPNVQFFITTHSPQIISSVNSESVFVCENFKINKVQLKTKGTDTNSLLKYIFNSTERPKEYIDLIEKFNKLMENDEEYNKLELIVDEIKKMDQQDTSNEISLLIDELNMQLSAYKFDKEHEKNN